MKHDDSRREALSAMADGEASPNELDDLCADWRRDPGTRERWHAYHLIGDALRSDDLAAAPARDEAFLQALRQRMGDQPVVLAPAVDIGRHGARPWMRWAAPAAVAAGFVTVAGVLVALRTATPPGGGDALVAGTPSAAPVPVQIVNGGAASPAALPELTLVDRNLIRDARLERYFSAHRGAAEGAALPLPGGTMRRVDVMVVGPGQ